MFALSCLVCVWLRTASISVCKVVSLFLFCHSWTLFVKLHLLFCVWLCSTTRSCFTKRSYMLHVCPSFFFLPSLPMVILLRKLSILLHCWSCCCFLLCFFLIYFRERRKGREKKRDIQHRRQNEINDGKNGEEVKQEAQQQASYIWEMMLYQK